MDTRNIIANLRGLARLKVAEGVTKAAADKLEELQQFIDDTTNDHYVDILDFYSKRCRELEDKIENAKANKPIISKDKFCQILTKLKDNESFIDKINDVLRKFGRDSYIFSTGLEDIIVRLLEDIFRDTDQWISYWVWEKGFGDNYEDGDAVDENGDIIHIKTAEELYNFLVKNMREAND